MVAMNTVKSLLLSSIGSSGRCPNEFFEVLSLERAVACDESNPLNCDIKPANLKSVITQKIERATLVDSLMTNPQFVLLDLLSTIRPVLPEQLTSLSSNEWSKLAHIADQHRLEPILHHQVQTRSLQPFLPPEIASKWATGYREAAIRSLILQRSIFNLKLLLDAANIPFLLVKGSWLAWNAYSHPALRPMRDIDILVRPEHAVDTFKILHAAGFSQSDSFSVPFDMLLKSNKHLPGMVCPETGTKVEIHVRLFTVDAKRYCPVELVDFDLLYQRRQVVGAENKQLAYLSTTDTLLHIIVHAVHEHMFNNGPVVIADVFHILNHGGIEWPYFWAVAAEANWINPAQLVFDLVEYYHGEQKIDWHVFNRGQTPTIIIQKASVLSLQDVGARSHFTMTVDLALENGLMAKTVRFCRRLFPTRYILADIGNVPAHSPRIIMFYPVWFFRVVQRLYKGKPQDLSASSLVNPVVRWLAR